MQDALLQGPSLTQRGEASEGFAWPRGSGFSLRTDPLNQNLLNPDSANQLGRSTQNRKPKPSTALLRCLQLRKIKEPREDLTGAVKLERKRLEFRGRAIARLGLVAEHLHRPGCYTKDMHGQGKGIMLQMS